MTTLKKDTRVILRGNAGTITETYPHPKQGTEYKIQLDNDKGTTFEIARNLQMI